MKKWAYIWLFIVFANPALAGGLKGPLFSDQEIFIFFFLVFVLWLASLLSAIKYHHSGRMRYAIISLILTIPFLVVALFILTIGHDAFSWLMLLPLVIPILNFMLLSTHQKKNEVIE